jgi:hypothetical protein
MYMGQRIGPEERITSFMKIDRQPAETSSPPNKGESKQKASTNEISTLNYDDKLHPDDTLTPWHWYTPLLSPLWLCLLAALLIRVWLTVRTHGILDGDEALLGIQAEHILQGERPIYFYGIPYFGSLEAYVAAILIAIFGPSVAVLRAETTAFSLILVSLTWWMASLLAKAAHLPHYAKRCFTIVAALVAAIPPLYDGIVELRTGGGWIESFALMLLLLIAVFRLTSRWHEGATNRELALRWAGVGFVVGFGMWIYPLVSVSIVAAALWIIIDRLAVIIKLVKASEPIAGAIIQSCKGLLLVVAAIPACLLGFSPGIIWGATNHWGNITYLFSLGGGWSHQRIHTVKLVSEMYATCVAPRIIGGATPLENTLLQDLHLPLLALGVVCIFVSFALIICSFGGQRPILRQARGLVGLPALFGTCTAVLFCTSSASASILIGCNDDLGGRYAAPLVLALPFFFATTFTIITMFIRKRRAVQQNENEGEVPTQYNQLSRRTPSQRLSVAALLAVFVVFFAYLGGQVTTYGLTNPDRAFQSPWCTIAPANYAPIITYMEQEHIHYAWATNLLGYQISFETNNNIIMADPLPVIHPSIAINRIPAYINAIEKADRPSFLVFVNHGDHHPYLLQLLDAEHVTYKAAFFPSEPGIDVMVVTPLSRTVSPFTSKSFDIFYCYAR